MEYQCLAHLLYFSKTQDAFLISVLHKDSLTAPKVRHFLLHFSKPSNGNRCHSEWNPASIHHPSSLPPIRFQLWRSFCSSVSTTSSLLHLYLGPTTLPPDALNLIFPQVPIQVSLIKAVSLVHLYNIDILHHHLLIIFSYLMSHLSVSVSSFNYFPNSIQY